MKRYSLFILSTVLLGSLLFASSAWAVKPADSPSEPPNPDADNSIDKFTAYPPFLPRIVAPNILFVFDYSQEMVRPAYGICTEDFTADANDCRTKFYNLSGGLYDPNREYEGYFRTITDPDFGTIGDVKYSWSSSSKLFSISSGAEWGGNWLNWLAMTQFDISKKVAAGGTINPSPDTAGTANTLYATSMGGHKFYQPVDRASCLANAPDALCNTGRPQVVPYNWFSPFTDSTETTLINGATALAEGDFDVATGLVTADLPFRFSYFGTGFPAGHPLKIDVNGWISFDDVTYTPEPPTPDTVAPNNLLAVYWDDAAGKDKDSSAGKDSKIIVHTVGEAPARIFVVTFYHIVNDDDPFANTSSSNGYPLTYQVAFFEGSNQVIFNYQQVQPTVLPFGAGRAAAIWAENGDGTQKKMFAQNGLDPLGGARLLTNNLALLMTPGYKLWAVETEGNSNQASRFYTFDAYNVAPLAANVFEAGIAINNQNPDGSGNCPPGFRLNKQGSSSNKGLCFDHPTEGLLHEFREKDDLGDLAFRLSVMIVARNSGDEGGKVYKHFNEKTDTSWSSIWNALRGNAQIPTTKASIAEALFEAQGYLRQNTGFELYNQDWLNTYTSTSPNCSSGNDYDPYCFESYNRKVPCSRSFVILVSSGYYTDDNGRSIFAADGAAATEWTTTKWDPGVRLIGQAYTGVPGLLEDIGVETAGVAGYRANGGWLDNVAYQMHAPDYSDNSKDGDLRFDVGMEGNQNGTLYVVDTYGHDFGLGGEVLKRASIFGGFEDADGDNTFDEGEQNILNATDPLPDTYYPAWKQDVKSAIVSAVNQILKNSSSGTSVSVLSTSAGGEGALYQAYFYPSKVIPGTQEDRNWPGYLRGFFLDRFGNLRDDHSQATLTATSTPDQALVIDKDRVAMMNLNEDTGQVTVDVFQHPTYNTAITVPASHLNLSMDDVPTMWEASEKLAQRDKATRRIFLWLDDPSSSTTDGTSVQPVVEGDFSGTLDSTKEARLFAPVYNSALYNSTVATLAPYLRAKDYVYNSVTYRTANQEASEIIQFIRGMEVPRYRSRCQGVDNPSSAQDGCKDTSFRAWPLGDIVFSTPTLVALPSEKYHQIYGINSAGYGQFYTEYFDRRQMIYVGANDGMLHAVNAGLYHEGDKPLTADAESGWFTANPADMTASAWQGDPPDLGDEVWAFVPQDNLPLLSFLACTGTQGDPLVCGEAEYTHIYYVDQRPKASDVRIFNDSATSVSGLIDGQPNVSHPNGWGTIIIVPMRLGGGAINVDLNADGDTSDAGEMSFRSAYYCFDVTDPEQPPRLLWRFTDANLGFSTSYPGIVRIKNVTDEEWYMVVGSGPSNTTSNRDYDFENTKTNGKVFVVDLKHGYLKRTFDLAANHIMGDPTMIDKDLDFSVDVIYIGANIGGTVGSTYQMTAGRVYRINTNKLLPASWTLSTLFDPVQAQFDVEPDPDNNKDKDMGPLLVGPSAALDSQRNLWVFFGTGRLRNKLDLTRSYQNRFYGIKDRCWKSTSDSACTTTVSGGDYSYQISDLVNTTAVRVTNQTGMASQVISGDEKACGSTTSAGDTCSFGTLLTTVRAADGWFVNLDNDNSSPELPSELVAARSSIIGGIVLFTTYIPTGDVCSVFGDSNLYALFYETGTAFIKPIVGTHTETISGVEKTLINKKADLGKGMPTSVGLAVGETIMGFVQQSTGAIKQIEQQPGLNIRSGITGWREDTSGGGTVEIETIYKHVVK